MTGQGRRESSAHAGTAAPIRVLHVDHSGLPGGGQLGLARYAALKSRHVNHFHFLSDGPVPQRLARQGVPVTVSSMAGVSMGNMLRGRRRLKKEVESFRPDLVVANSLRSAVALAVARPNARMLYYVRQDMSAASMGRLTRAIANILVFPRFGAFLANSRWTLTTIPRRFRNRPAAIAHPLSGVASAAGPTRPPGGMGEIRFLWLGRIAHWKGLHVVLEAMRSLEHKGIEVGLAIAGAPIHEDADYDKAMREMARELRRPPAFLGHVNDVGAVLVEHDVLIHSSVLPEPFGQVVVQGMAAGLAVVATRPGGPAEVVDHGSTGWLVPCGEADAIARVMEEIVRERLDVDRVGRNAALAARARYSDAALGVAFDEAIQELYDRMGPGRKVRLR